MRSLQFKVGDKAVHKLHGVGVIQGIETEQINGHTVNWYVLQLLGSGVKAKVPVSTGANSVIRGIISCQEVDNIYTILKTPSHIPQTSWNRRFTKFRDKLTTGSVTDVAEVLRDLSTLQEQKDLSSSEKEMMKRARERIALEISAASSKSLKSVEKELNQILLTPEGGDLLAKRSGVQAH